MNILLINHYAGAPALGMEYRPYYLAREWVRLGHRVTIVAASYSHVRTRQPAPPAGAGGAAPAQWDETIDGVTYRWIATPAYRGNDWGRARNVGCFLARVWRQASHLAAQCRPEAVIASSTYPMDVWVARRIARRARAKLVFEVHDLWPLSPVELSGMSPSHPFVRLCARAEATAYRDADRVVSMLPNARDYMAGRGLDPGRLEIVPNGISPDEWSGPHEALREDVAAAVDAQRALGRTVVGYAGSMGLPNALDVLLDAAALLRAPGAGPRPGRPPREVEGLGSGPSSLERDAGIAIVLVGDGHERERLARRIADERLDAVRLLPPIPKSQVPAFLERVDIAYLGWQRSPIYRFGIAPNKLMDYMMAARPVLHSVEAGNDPVGESGCGLTVEPESATAVADGLRRLAALPAHERQAMGERGRAFVLTHHAYPALARRFVQAMQR